MGSAGLACLSESSCSGSGFEPLICWGRSVGQMAEGRIHLGETA